MSDNCAFAENLSILLVSKGLGNKEAATLAAEFQEQTQNSAREVSASLELSQEEVAFRLHGAMIESIKRSRGIVDPNRPTDYHPDIILRTTLSEIQSVLLTEAAKQTKKVQFEDNPASGATRLSETIPRGRHGRVVRKSEPMAG